MPTQLARQQIADLRGKAKASFILAVQDLRRRGCQAAGVRLAGEQLSSICRLEDLNRFLRGWAAYFRYGHPAQRLSKIRRYAQMRLVSAEAEY